MEIAFLSRSATMTFQHAIFAIFFERWSNNKNYLKVDTRVEMKTESCTNKMIVLSLRHCPVTIFFDKLYLSHWRFFTNNVF